jgi:hypothetical protein
LGGIASCQVAIKFATFFWCGCKCLVIATWRILARYRVCNHKYSGHRWFLHHCLNILCNDHLSWQHVVLHRQSFVAITSIATTIITWQETVLHLQPIRDNNYYIINFFIAIGVVTTEIVPLENNVITTEIL